MAFKIEEVKAVSSLKYKTRSHQWHILLVMASPGLGEEGKLYLLIGRIHTRRERFAGGYL